MTTAHAILTTFRENLALLPADRDVPRAVVLHQVDEALAALGESQAPGLSAALLGIADRGGVSPHELGKALRPDFNTYRAGNLGSTRLNSLCKLGFVRTARHAWWVLTDAGAAEVARLRKGRGL